MSLIMTAADLRDAFGIQNDTTTYEGFIPFKDGRPGFSIQRNYPPDIAFKPSVTKDGSQNTVAMIRVLYNPKNLPETDFDLDKVPIWIDIGKHSKYQYGHFGYNFEDKDCPTEESLAESQASPRPVELNFSDSFFFNHSSCDFIDKSGKHLSGMQVLQIVFEKHCSTTRGSKRQIWRSIARVGFFCEHLIVFLEYILRVSFRKRFDRSRNPLMPYRKEDIVLLEAESIKIFEYKTTKNVVVTYAGLVLVAYTLSYWTCLRQSTYLAAIWKHPFLLLCVTLVTLPLLEHQGPNLIRIVVNVLNRVRWWSIMHSPLYSDEKNKKLRT